MPVRMLSKTGDRAAAGIAAMTTPVARRRGARPMTLPAPDPAFHWTQRALGPRAALPRARRRRATFVYLEATGVAGCGGVARRAGVGRVGADRLMRVKQVHGNVVRILKRGEVPDDASERAPGWRRDRVERAGSGVGGDGRRLRADSARAIASRRGRGDSRRLARHLRARRQPRDRRHAARVRHRSRRI